MRIFGFETDSRIRRMSTILKKMERMEEGFIKIIEACERTNKNTIGKVKNRKKF